MVEKSEMNYQKKLFRLLSFSIVIALGSALTSFTAKQRTYQTECVTIETDGYVVLKLWDIKRGSKYKFEQARKDAVHCILFSGISSINACSTQPPLLNSSEEKEKFKAIEKSFFAKNGIWSMYTRSSAVETTLPTMVGVKNWKVYQISISKNELRKYLEDQKIIKSLNNGF
jgi:hypothetical protein